MSAMFETQAAYSPENQQLVKGATFTAHDVDSGETLPTMDSLGSAMTLMSDSNGFLPPFKVAGDRTQVEIRNGAFKTVITTVAGTVDAGVVRAITEDGPAKDALSATFAGKAEVYTKPQVDSAVAVAGITRRFVIFGDSWTTTLEGVNIPSTAIALLGSGATLVKNHGVAGAMIGPTSQNSGNTTDAQVTAAQADTSYDKSTITDVVVLAAVNNIGGYLPTVAEAKAHFNAIGNLYPKARRWYVANSKKAINNAGDNDPWRWYSRFFEGAGLAGFAGAQWSPNWNWGTARNDYWLAGSTDTNRHMSATGQTAWAERLAAFLRGEEWRPYFKVATSLHPNLAALMVAEGLSATPTISTDDSTVVGDVLRLDVSIGSADGLSAVSTSALQPVLQIPSGYAPIGNYNRRPIVGARLSGGTMDWYTAEVSSAGVVSVDPRALNNHVGYFLLQGDLPLRKIKVA